MKIRLGDIYAIPIDQNSSALAQVVGEYEKSLFLAVFHGRHESDRIGSTALDELIADVEVALVALTFDARIQSGDWPYCTSSSTVRSDVLPAYICDTPDGWIIENAQGKATKPASSSDRAKLPLRTIVSAMIVEDAVQALHGFIPWTADYDELRVPDASSRSEVIFAS